MKKVVKNFCFFIAVTISCYGGHERIADRVAQAKEILAQKGINAVSAAEFKEEMLRIISRLPKEKKALISMYESESVLPEILLSYSTEPTDKSAEILRAWVATDNFWAEIIVPEMNKQSEPRYRFNARLEDVD